MARPIPLLPALALACSASSPATTPVQDHGSTGSSSTGEAALDGSGLDPTRGGSDTTTAGSSSADDGDESSSSSSSSGGAEACPPTAGVALHFVDPDAEPHWDSILALAADNPAIRFVGQHRPPQVQPCQWAAYLSYRSDPQPTAADIDALLAGPQPPSLVMLEELHDASSEAFFVAIATTMRDRYPQWAGRWGAFVGFGDYPLLGAGIDALLQADAVLSLELYPRGSEYCAAGADSATRDAWLAEQFAGNAEVGRTNWLLARREHWGSASVVSPLLGVGDVLLDVDARAVFLDRMFFVWVTRTDHGALIDAAHGGPGAYKWTPPTPLGYGVGNTSRDLAFSQSYTHYGVDGRSDARLGEVACP